MSKRHAEAPLAEEMASKKQKVADDADATKNTSIMPKRPADGPLTEETVSKKLKVADGADIGDVTPIMPIVPITPTTGPTGDQSPNVPNEATPAETTDAGEAASSEGENGATVLEEQVDAGMEEERSKPMKAGKPTKNPPIKDVFTPWQPTVTVPKSNDFWGMKPLPGDPRPHPVQPSARESNGATNPPMWEDRKYRFKRGARHVKYFGPVAPEDVKDLPEDLDQEDLLVVQLIDMRPKSKRDPTPKRIPVTYHYDGGKPNDWNSMQAIKCLNDRRAQAIDRITLDAPWTRIEREYLASLFKDFPDASIWELTERHNDRFMGQDFGLASGFSFANLSEGRTVESVRHEYNTYKPVYDQGEVPDFVRFRNDNSREGKALRASKAMEAAFGPADKALEKEWDAQNGSDNEDAEDTGDENEEGATIKTPKQKPSKAANTAKKATLKKRANTKKSEAFLVESDDEFEPKSDPEVPIAEQPKLGEVEEELLELAGVYNPGEIRHSPPHSLPPDSPRQTEDTVVLTPPSVRSSSPHTRDESPIDPEVAQAIEEIFVEKTQVEIEETTEEVTTNVDDASSIGQTETLTQTTTTEATQDETVTVERRPSVHAARKLELDESYSDDEEL